MSWFEDTPESRRLDAEEGLILDTTELICEALEERGVTRAQLAEALGIRPSEVTMRLRGGRNLTLRTVAAMLHVLDFDAVITKRDRRDEAVIPSGKAVPVSVDAAPEFPVHYVDANPGRSLLPTPKVVP